MHLLVIFVQYLLGRLSNKQQSQPVAVPVRRASMHDARQAFESSSVREDRTANFLGAVWSGMQPGSARLRAARATEPGSDELAGGHGSCRGDTSSGSDSTEIFSPPRRA